MSHLAKKVHGKGQQSGKSITAVHVIGNNIERKIVEPGKTQYRQDQQNNRSHVWILHDKEDRGCQSTKEKKKTLCVYYFGICYIGHGISLNNLFMGWP